MAKQMADLMIRRALAIDEVTRTDPGVIAVLTRELRKLDAGTLSTPDGAPNSLDGMPDELADWLASANQKADELTRTRLQKKRAKGSNAVVVVGPSRCEYDRHRRQRNVTSNTTSGF
jgi:hypothetical protein